MKSSSVFQVGIPSDENFLQPNTLDDLLSTATAAETTETSEAALDHSEKTAELLEHQYCLPAPDQKSPTVQMAADYEARKTIIEPSFAIYNQIARYLCDHLTTSCNHVHLHVTCVLKCLYILQVSEPQGVTHGKQQKQICFKKDVQAFWPIR